MQNGMSSSSSNSTFPWVNPAAALAAAAASVTSHHSPSSTSSLAANSHHSKVSSGHNTHSHWPPGYQSSLTNLILKNQGRFTSTGSGGSVGGGGNASSGISQLAAASSYLEKMSNQLSLAIATSSSSSHHPNEELLSPGHHQQPPVHQHQAEGTTEGQHKHKDKAYESSCQICVSNSSIRSTTASNKSHQTSSSIKSSNVASPSSERHKSLEEQPEEPSTFSFLTSGAAAGHAYRRSSSDSASSNSSRQRIHNQQSGTAPISKQFLCPICHRCFTQKGNLKTHMMIHTGEKPYSCQMCGKSFTQKGNVDTHLKIHTGEKDYNCGACGKKFTQKGNLRTHVRSVHTKEKPFVCSICGKGFSQKGNMQTHFRTHNKDDRFPCHVCGKTFSQKGNLKTHMGRHNGQVPTRKTPAGRIKQTQQQSFNSSSSSSSDAIGMARRYAMRENEKNHRSVDKSLIGVPSEVPLDQSPSTRSPSLLRDDSLSPSEMNLEKSRDTITQRLIRSATTTGCADGMDLQRLSYHHQPVRSFSSPATPNMSGHSPPSWQALMNAGKHRMVPTSTPYENLAGLTVAYSGFGHHHQQAHQAHPALASKLALFGAPTATAFPGSAVPVVGTSESITNAYNQMRITTGELLPVSNGTPTTSSSSARTSNSAAQNQASPHHHAHHQQYSQGNETTTNSNNQSNPDFSQLLE